MKRFKRYSRTCDNVLTQILAIQETSQCGNEVKMKFLSFYSLLLFLQCLLGL